MKKDFKEWTNLKKSLDNTDASRLFFHTREIWYCHLGENIGFEQDGRSNQYLRPVIVVCKFNNDIFWAIPLTHTKKDSPFYYQFIMVSESNSEDEISTAVLSQIRLIDAKRLRRQIGYISNDDFEILKKKLKALLP